MIAGAVADAIVLKSVARIELRIDVILRLRGTERIRGHAGSWSDSGTRLGALDGHTGRRLISYHIEVIENLDLGAVDLEQSLCDQLDITVFKLLDKELRRH